MTPSASVIEYVASRLGQSQESTSPNDRFCHQLAHVVDLSRHQSKYVLLCPTTTNVRHETQFTIASWAVIIIKTNSFEMTDNNLSQVGSRLRWRCKWDRLPEPADKRPANK